jgi:plasmid maintenance system antidote protein VapI
VLRGLPFANERPRLSLEVTLPIEKSIWYPETLMRMQNSYDIARARKQETEINRQDVGMKTKGQA